MKSRFQNNLDGAADMGTYFELSLQRFIIQMPQYAGMLAGVPIDFSDPRYIVRFRFLKNGRIDLEVGYPEDSEWRIGDAQNGYSWEYYCDADHDNLTGEIGDCLTADELLAKVMELTDSENMGVDEDACKELIESYLDMFKEELGIDEDDFRKFGAADNEKAQEFYQLLITDELPNADLWEVDTPFSDDEE